MHQLLSSYYLLLYIKTHSIIRRRFTGASSHLDEGHFSCSSPYSLPFSCPYVDINKYLNKYVNGDKETHLCCTRIPNNYCSYFIFQEEGSDSSGLKCRLCIVTSSPKLQDGMGENDNLKFKKIFFHFNWKIITLKYCDGFCHTSAWICHGYTCFLPSWTPLLPLSPPYLFGFPRALGALLHASNLYWSSRKRWF